MKLSLFDYYLPQELIAQNPQKPRDHSRLMILDKKQKTWQHDYFYNLPKYLSDNDVLIFNDSKVFPARLKMQKETGGKVEIFLLNQLKPGAWEAMVRGRVKTNDQLHIANDNLILNFKCEIIKKLANGNWHVQFNYSGKKFRDILEKIGETPLPPYIKTKDSKNIRDTYQTTFAKHEGSVAAPTAGLHFNKRLLNNLTKQGVKLEFITLHVGLGTFQPVKTQKIEEHKIHSEYANIDKSTTNRLNGYKKQGKRIIAVGTTVCRTLEAFCDKKGKLATGSRGVDIYIYPSYEFKFIDSLITNFHLPKSTLLMLVSALAGRKFVLGAYKEAIKEKYGFYSFGDGMLII